LVDVSELIVWSTIVQTIVLSLTLVIFALSFRSQNKTIQEQAYQKVMDDYGECYEDAIGEARTLCIPARTL